MVFNLSSTLDKTALSNVPRCMKWIIVLTSWALWDNIHLEIIWRCIVYLRLWVHMHSEKITQRHNKRRPVSQDLEEKLWVHGFFFCSCDSTSVTLRTPREKKTRSRRIQRETVVKSREMLWWNQSCNSYFFFPPLVMIGNSIALKSIIYLIIKTLPS